jgi:nucleotide-binding universal stress UspA family protein
MNAIPSHILVATDFSPAGERAQALALDLARTFGAALHLLHVQVLLDDPHLDREHHAALETFIDETDERRRAALQASLSGVDVEVHTHLVRGISAAEAIVETCGDLGCELVVVGTRGRRGLTHLLLGSVAERVLRTSPVPVLTVGPDGSGQADGIRRILTPYDFSPYSAEALRTAAAWARRLGAEVTVMHVVEPVVYPEFYAVDMLPEEMLGRLKTRSDQALREAVAELLPGLQTKTVVRVGRASDAIVSEAAPSDYDMVVMGTRGLSAIEHLLLGSVAESVLRRAHVPLLAVRGENGNTEFEDDGG